jgi:hypothetical protein
MRLCTIEWNMYEKKCIKEGVMQIGLNDTNTYWLQCFTKHFECIKESFVTWFYRMQTHNNGLFPFNIWNVRLKLELINKFIILNA